MRVRASNQLGSIVFDAVLKVEHTSSLTITEHPVETGGSITDHSYMNPKEISMEVGVSDSGTLYTRGRKGKSVSTFKALQQLQASRRPFRVTTRLGSYSNMLIANMSTPDDYTTANALKVSLILQEIPMVSSSTVKVAGRTVAGKSQKTGKTNNGTKQAVPVTNQSILYGVASSLGGKK